ncbi:MAG: protein kinase [Ktedonobacteraceae bacterium]|nr:protein kinase [Ktedonobacteraceae bacterium]
MDNSLFDQCVGQTIGNCRIEQLVSHGRMSVVYRAQQLQSSQPVAFVVFYLPETISPQAIQQFRTRFQREAPELTHLRHPHLLPFHGHGEWEGWPYLITPYRTEGSLVIRIKQQGPQDPARILYLLEQVIAGLEYAHSNGQIHGMLTPANLLLNKDGSLEIAALGLQRLVERRGILSCATSSEWQSTLTGEPLCAPKYLAPEYQQGHKADVRSDVYSLGVLLVELLQGSLLEKNMHPQQIIKQLDRRLPAPLQRVLYRALAEDPARRFQNVNDVLTAYAEHADALEPVEIVETLEPVETVEKFIVESLPQSFPIRSLPITPLPLSSSAPDLDLKIDDDQIPANEFWMDTDFAQKWSPSGIPSPGTPLVASSRTDTFTSPLQMPPVRLLQPRKISRRRTTALLAGGLVAGIVGIGGISLAQNLSTGKAPQTAQANLPTNSGQTAQAPNSAVALVDTRQPDHRQRLLVHLPDGNFIAYKQGCTHTGVLVNYDPKTKLLVCPAHGAIFDPAQGGKVIKGPATTPLPQVGIKISGSGVITLI